MKRLRKKKNVIKSMIIHILCPSHESEAGVIENSLFQPGPDKGGGESV